MKSFVAFAILSAMVAFTYATPFTDCGSKTGQVSAVEITDCPDDQDTCILKRGSEAGIKINFASKCDSKSLKAVVHGVISGVPLPFPIPQSDGCKSGVSCPVKNGQSYTYSNSLNVMSAYPPVSVTVRWELKDDTGSDIACVEMPCQLQ